ncbi:hypothetical protein AGMMS49525_11740 [Bacteroidia bacterium]|nr:hypothetical protein AGMMS49525_11740 [Bacteroidia bacterium]
MSQVTINGIDIAIFGVILTKDSYSNLFAYPTRKEPLSNKWQDEDGADVDLSDPVFEARTFKLSFYSYPNANLYGFFELLMSEGYKTFQFVSIDLQMKLRYKSEPSRNLYTGGDTFELQFIDDFPMSFFQSFETFEETGVNRMLPKQPNFKIDGLEFSEYGIGIIKGSNDYKNPALKDQLTLIYETVSGQTYNVGTVKKESGNIVIKCWILASNIQSLKNKYVLFFNKIASESERILDTDNHEYTCYYKSASDFKLYRDSETIALTFSLNFVEVSRKKKEGIEFWAIEYDFVVS